MHYFTVGGATTFDRNGVIHVGTEPFFFVEHVKQHGVRWVKLYKLVVDVNFKVSVEYGNFDETRCNFDFYDQAYNWANWMANMGGLKVLSIPPYKYHYVVWF